MKYFLTAVLSVSLLSVGVGQAPSPADPHAGHKMTEMPKQMATMNEMIPGYLGSKDASFDKRFIDMMIPHHEGAIIAAKHV